MREFIEFPEYAHVRLGGWFLHILERRVIGNNMFAWHMDVMKGRHRKMLASEMSSALIKFEAAMKQCIHELGDPEHAIPWMVNHYWHLAKNKPDSTAEFARSKCAKKISQMYIQIFRTCKNWDDLAKKTKPSGVFGIKVKKMAKDELKKMSQKKIKNVVQPEVKSCTH